jgi:DNA-binding MarR family transcriptional regulator
LNKSKIDTSYLEQLLGYNARRAALVIIERFIREMAPFDLRPVDFSVLSVIFHNPGVTSRQLCSTLSILPPNLVGLIKAFEKRGLIERRPHPSDGRALGLHATAAGQTLMQQAEQVALHLEQQSAHQLSTTEQAQLIEFLKKIYH